MSLTLRNVKGSPLTYTEMDDNLTYLEGLGNGASSSIAGLSFSAVLGVGNDTNGNDIILSDGDVVKAENGTGELNLRAGADNIASLASQDGDIISVLELDPAFNNNGTRLYSEDTDSGEISSIAIEPTAIETQVVQDKNNATLALGVFTSVFNLRNGDLKSALELDPNENAAGTRLYTEDTDSGDFSGLEVKSNNVNIETRTTSGDLSILGLNPISVLIETRTTSGDLSILGLNPGESRYVALSGIIQSGLDLDPGENITNPGTKLYTSDATSGDKSEIKLKPDFLEARVETGDLKSGLELDPAENNFGTKLYTLDTNSEELSQTIITPTSTINQTLDSNFSVYLSSIETSFVPGSFRSNDTIRFTLQASNLGGSGIADITGQVDLVTDESKIVISSDVLLLPTIPTYADNAAAITGGATANQVYKTSTGELRIVV